jgi:ligand-binding sensor domain-containing protein
MKSFGKFLPDYNYCSYAAFIFISLLLLCIPLSLPSAAAGIREQISFQNILENKDIAMGEGRVIFQDSEGFIWFGGYNALIRYDGYEFRQIYVSTSGDKPDEKETVKFVQGIFEDSRQTLWIATRSGILLFDPNTEKLTRIKDDDHQEIKISSDIMGFVELPSGEILAGSMSGLFVIDPQSLKYTVILPDATKQNWLKSKRVFKIYLDGNDIWLGTEEGLEKLDWGSKTFTLYKLNN